MRLSRPCYDKMHRCPGWAGGGMRYAKVDRCADGRLHDPKREHIYEGRWWRWRFNRCDTCDVLVLPYVIRYVDPRWWGYVARSSGLFARLRKRWLR
jgi:hypothetical protein